MTASDLFSLANMTTLVAWAALVVAIVFNRAILRDAIGRWVPLALALLYTALIVFFFGKAEGGFDTLANVQKLFTSEWVALAGWVHYLSFDLFVGGWIARQVMENGLSRWILLPLLPLTFMFGPAGLLGFQLASFLFTRKAA
jgi:hypothetical protein